MTKQSERHEPYASLAEVRAHFDELSARGVCDLNLGAPVESPELLREILDQGRKREVSISRLRLNNPALLGKSPGQSALAER